nr:hypothetical protein [Tanacetum cinerariifolium]
GGRGVGGVGHAALVVGKYVGERHRRARRRGRVISLVVDGREARRVAGQVAEHGAHHRRAVVAVARASIESRVDGALHSSWA